MKSIVAKVVIASSSLLLFNAPPRAWSCGQTAATLIELPFPAGAIWRATALNGTNEMTGYVIVPGSGETHAFFYRGSAVTDLGTLGGGYGQGLFINAAGQVAGESSLSNGGVRDPFLWTGGSLLDLGNLGGSWCSPTAINDSAQVAGFSFTPGDAGMLGFLYANGSMNSLGALGGDQSYALGLNQAGVVVGGAALANGDFHAFSYSAGVMTNLGTLGGNYSSASAINSVGMIVGESSLPNGDTHGFVYAAGVMTDVGTLGGTGSSCFAVNTQGDVIGYSITANGETHGFIWRNGTMTDLGTLGGGFSSPAALNNLGQVVGLSATGSGAMHAFVWQKGAMVDLNSLLTANSGWELTSGELINDQGRIAGSGSRAGADQAFVLDLAAGNNPPVANAGPDQNVECQSQVVLDGSASADPDGDPLTYEWSAGGYVLGTNAILSGTFALGTYSVTLKVTDPCGLSSLATVVVRVLDSVAPAIQSLAVSPDVLSPPNHKLVPITVSATVADACDATPLCKILSITANEATEPGDIQITGKLTATLAASRNPSGGGRAYTITVQATDAAGNNTISTIKVTVPQGDQPIGFTANSGAKPKGKNK